MRYRCNEVGFLQEGAPSNHPTIVTRLVQPAYDEVCQERLSDFMISKRLPIMQRQCTLMFPGAWSSPPVPAANKVNAAYDGWNVSIDHLFFANGQR